MSEREIMRIMRNNGYRHAVGNTYWSPDGETKESREELGRLISLAAGEECFLAPTVAGDLKGGTSLAVELCWF